MCIQYNRHMCKCLKFYVCRNKCIKCAYIQFVHSYEIYNYVKVLKTTFYTYIIHKYFECQGLQLKFVFFFWVEIQTFKLNVLI